MKKRFFFVLLVGVCGGLKAQVDTLGRNPFVYVYDFPVDSVNRDSVHCPLSVAPLVYGGVDEDAFWQRSAGFTGYSVYMHTDDTLRVVGVAAGYYGGANIPQHQLSLYDSSMTELALAHAHYFIPPYTGSISVSDTNYIRLSVPGARETDQSGYPFRKIFFGDGIVVEVVGDFYLGLQKMGNAVWTDLGHVYSPVRTPMTFVYEDHGEPYHFGPRRYRMSVQRDTLKGWEDYVSLRSVPLLFPLVEPRCERVDSVRVLSDSAGCVYAAWDTLPRQREWAVRLLRGGEAVGGEDTVRSPEWRRCGLEGGEEYTVAVRSRCRNLNTYSWSGWRESGGVTAEAPVGVESVERGCGIRVEPNPARVVAEVLLGCPLEGEGELRLGDAGGRVLRVLRLEGGTERCVLPLEGLVQGVYVLTLRTRGGVSSLRVAVGG